jgi:hypothetical protein
MALQNPNPNDPNWFYDPTRQVWAYGGNASSQVRQTETPTQQANRRAAEHGGNYRPNFSTLDRQAIPEYRSLEQYTADKLKNTVVGKVAQDLTSTIPSPSHTAYQDNVERLQRYANTMKRQKGWGWANKA